MNRTQVNTNINESEDIYEEVDIKTATVYNEPFPRQAFQIHDNTNNDNRIKKKFKLSYFFGFITLCFSFFCVFYFYLNDEQNSNKNFSLSNISISNISTVIINDYVNPTPIISLSNSISISQLPSISSLSPSISSSLSSSMSPSISQSISSSTSYSESLTNSISNSLSLSVQYDYYVDNRYECIVYSSYWCDNSCKHSPPVCPNCCIRKIN